MAQSISEQEILNALKVVKDPDLNRDIVSLGFVKKIKIDQGKVSFDLELTTPACPVKEELKKGCEEAVRKLPGVSHVAVELKSHVSSRPQFGQTTVLPQVRNVIAVASGKGGVGKSTVTANLALALSDSGAKVGLLDCDIYGPSIPTMFGVRGKKLESTVDQKILPLKACGISLLSIGFLSDDKTAVIWRGPMVHQIIQQFLTRVEWGELDYLLLDLPPGTGDAQLTITQTVALSGAVIITTPQEVSLIDARKALVMFEKVKVPILGIIENMSYFGCAKCGEVAEIFKRGGAQKIGDEYKVPILGEIPIDPHIVVTGDDGLPIVRAEPDSLTAKIYRMIAGAVAARMSVSNLTLSEAASLNVQWQNK